MQRLATFCLVLFMAFALSMNMLLGLTLCLCPQTAAAHPLALPQTSTTLATPTCCSHDHNTSTDTTAHKLEACDHHTTLSFTHVKLVDERSPSLINLVLLTPPPFLTLLAYQSERAPSPPPLWRSARPPLETANPFLFLAPKRFPRA